MTQVNIENNPNNEIDSKHAKLCWSLGGVIKVMRQNLSWLPEDCSTALGISKEKLHAIEWGRCDLSVEDYLSVLDKLSLHFAD